jgi:hypothetical protein
MISVFIKTKNYLLINSFSVFLAICLVVTIFPLSAMGAVDPALVLFMPFEEGSGETTKDMSGKGNDGKLVGGLKWSNGKFGKALEFDGTSGYVLIQSSDSLQPDDSDFTIETWINADPSSVDWARVVDKFYGTGYCFGKVGAELTIGSEFGGNPNSFASVTPVFDKKWHHVAVVRDIKTIEGDVMAFLYIYVDGKNESKTIPPNVKLRNLDTTPVRIGAGDQCCAEGPPEDVAYFFKGIIDEVAIYRKALTEDEIKKDMSQGIPVIAVKPTTWAEVKK